ncbi:MAG: NAD-dependent epimerase/dehydratase family protein [Bacteroidota bacterium]
MGIKIIITGATGMVGEGVLHECLNHPEVSGVLAINRRIGNTSHPKLTEIIHQDFTNFEGIKDQLKGYDACFCCMGVTSVGKDEATFHQFTYNLTLPLATLVASLNPNAVLTYVSGKGTDSSEKGSTMWARVKGKTENDLMQLPFKGAYMFRPGYLHPTPGLKNTLKLYRWMGWLYPILKTFFPGSASSLKELGLAMIKVALTGNEKKVVEVKDILALAKK